MIYVMNIMIFVCALLFAIGIVYATAQSLKNLSEINCEKDQGGILEEKFLEKKANIYVGILALFIVPKEFLLMKNRGNNLCEAKEKISYVDYEVNDLFM